MDVTLAGLARDGGLYVPETWPRLSAEAIAGFAGKPYAEVAVEVIRPFVGDTISDAELSRLAREAYGTFRHPAVVPVAQFGAGTFLLELFHGPTLAFKDVAMQLLARLMDHALAARGERTTIVVATSGDTGGAAVEAFRGRERADLFGLFPQGRSSDVHRRMMATGTYDVREVVATSSPSMDIQVSSNFERLLFEATGRDAAAVRAMMASLAQSGRFSLSSEALSRVRALFNADRADEEETAATIRTT